MRYPASHENPQHCKVGATASVRMRNDFDQTGLQTNSGYRFVQNGKTTGDAIGSTRVTETPIAIVLARGESMKGRMRACQKAAPLVPA